MISYILGPRYIQSKDKNSTKCQYNHLVTKTKKIYNTFTNIGHI